MSAEGWKMKNKLFGGTVKVSAKQYDKVIHERMLLLNAITLFLENESIPEEAKQAVLEEVGTSHFEKIMDRWVFLG